MLGTNLIIFHRCKSVNMAKQLYYSKIYSKNIETYLFKLVHDVIKYAYKNIA